MSSPVVIPRPSAQAKGYLRKLAAAFLLACIPGKLYSATETGDHHVAVDTKRGGQLSHWRLEGKDLITLSATPPLLRVKFGPSGNSHQDFMAKALVGEFRLHPRSVQRDDKKGLIHLEGEISVKGEPLIAFTCNYRLGDPRRLRATLRLTPLAGLKEYSIQEILWQFPLSLRHRKRIYYPGENGLSWDTRYFYQFHTDTRGRLLPLPDRNEWQIFSLDQITGSAFTLWRSEDESTHPLIMQYGRITPAFVQVYDEEGGIAMKYSELRSQAPKSLQVHASEGGNLAVALWPASERPLSLHNKAGMKTVFHQDHQVTLLGTVGEAATLNVRNDLANADLPDSRPDPDKVFEEEEWLQNVGKKSGGPHLITGGYPLPRGLAKDPESVSVVMGGRRLATQSKAIGFWPDGSIKWALLSFISDPVIERKDSKHDASPHGGPVVTYRNAPPVPVEIRVMNDNAEPIPKLTSTLTAKETADGIAIDTGRLRVELAKGQRWLQSVQLGGRELLDVSRSSRLAYADYWMGPTKVAPFASLPEGGRPETGALHVESLRLEEAGPLRCLVRLEGKITGPEAMRVILRIETTAGSGVLKITHSGELLTKDPRKVWLRGFGLEIPLKSASLTEVRFGGETPVEIPATVSRSWLHQRTPHHYEVRGEDPEELMRLQTGAHSHGWVQASGKDFGVIAAVRNYWQQAPGALEIDHRNPTLKVAFWPEQGPLMDLRRYSNFPHRSQGEGFSDATSPDWADRMYYRKSPVVGLSRTHEVLLKFYQDAAPDAEEIAANFQSPPLLYAGWKQYHQSGVILPTSERWGRYWRNADRFAAFWLWHRQFDHWYGFWNFGDIRHFFGTGYGWIFPPEVLKQSMSDLQADRPPQEQRGKRILDYAPSNDWAFDNGRWGWANTEGLPNLFFQHEYLRTGRRTLYFLAESMAQRSRDVVVRQSGEWFGKGTRHGVQPWSDGNHEERQTTHTEFKLHYFLSGDARTRDVAEKLYKEFYSRTSIAIHAAHSARLYGLLTHWEMTGEPAEGEQLKSYIAHFLSPDGIYLQPNVSFPGPVEVGPPMDLNGTSMFFHTFGGLHALLEYYYLTEDSALRQSLIAMAHHALTAAGDDPVAHNYWGTIAFAARHAEDPEPFQQALIKALASDWSLVYQTVSSDPRFWSGSHSFLIGNAPRSFFWMTIAPYVVGAFPKDPVWNEAISKEMESLTRKGIVRPERKAGWQSEYDGFSELEDYLGSSRPWSLPLNPVETKNR